jgi:catechol 2,3-dioxygenase-like lactoylglutathione lyase family enzyme
VAVSRIDHVNIRTPDMAGTIAFFRDMLGMTPIAAPGRDMAENTWLLDAGGKAAVHVNHRADVPGAGNGAFHHVALECTGHDGMLQRLCDAGHDVRTNRIDALGLRQLFVHDPNGVLVELNFRGD